MLEAMRNLPPRWHGLWERTLLERKGPGSLTNDMPTHVYWLQTPLWHADLRVPLERPDFSGISSLEACDDNRLRFIAGQEAFCGITRVEGAICTWSRLHDLKPGSMLDVARMEFKGDDFILETGLEEAYIEHWERVPGSGPEEASAQPPVLQGADFFLQTGSWGICVSPREAAPDDVDLYAEPTARSREHLLWQARLVLSLCEKSADGWFIRHSTHPWLENQVMEAAKRETLCA